MSLRKRFFETIINFYGPFVGAGIRLKFMSKDFRKAHVTMGLTFYNKNYMGTQFGGSLYAMVDPWYMLMLIKNLGNDYIVWDKAATIHFRKPGTGRVHAHFDLKQEQIDEIKETLKTQTKLDYIFKVQIIDDSGKLIAESDKVLYVRKKSQ